MVFIRANNQIALIANMKCRTGLIRLKLLRVSCNLSAISQRLTINSYSAFSLYTGILNR